METILRIMREALSDARSRSAMDEYALILLGIARLQEMSALADVPTARLRAVRAKEERAA